MNLIPISDIRNVFIPTSCKYLKIDIGLAGDAPNSAIWLSDTSDRFVIGIEPLEYHWKHMSRLGSPDGLNIIKPWKIVQFEDNTIVQNGQKVCDIGDRFCGILGAIDNVATPKIQKFYKNIKGRTGSSSLLKPQDLSVLDSTIEIDTFSVEYMLDNLPRKFDFIEHIKTDCEGKDLSAVKSIGKYLTKTVFISSEVRNNNLDEWVGTQNSNEFFSFMLGNNFSVLNDSGSNVDFINNSLKPLVDQLKLTCNTLGL